MLRSRTYLSVKFYLQHPNKCQRRRDSPLYSSNTCADGFFMLAMAGAPCPALLYSKIRVEFSQHNIQYQKEKETHSFDTEIFYVDNKSPPPKTLLTISIYLEDGTWDLWHQNDWVYQKTFFPFFSGLSTLFTIYVQFYLIQGIKYPCQSHMSKCKIILTKSMFKDRWHLSRLQLECSNYICTNSKDFFEFVISWHFDVI